MNAGKESAPSTPSMPLHCRHQSNPSGSLEDLNRLQKSGKLSGAFNLTLSFLGPGLDVRNLLQIAMHQTRIVRLVQLDLNDSGH